MKCSKCGYPLRKGKPFCPHCGAKVKRFPVKWVITIVVIIGLIGSIGFAYFNQNTTKDNTIESEKETVSEKTEGAEEGEESKEEGYIPIAGSKASSELRENKHGLYKSADLYDNDLSTPWCEASSGSGLGEWVRLDFPEEYTVTKLEFYNGFMASYELLAANSQIRTATLSFSDNSMQTVEISRNFTLSDAYSIVLDEPVKTSFVRVRIDAVYLGTKYQDTCLSELRVIGYGGDTVDLPPMQQTTKDNPTIEKIRSIYYETEQNLKSYEQQDGGGDTVRYLNSERQIVKIIAFPGAYDSYLSDTSLHDYTAEYYYSDDRLVFAFVHNENEEYRFYLDYGLENPCIRYIDADGNIHNFGQGADPSVISDAGQFCGLGQMEIHWAES